MKQLPHKLIVGYVLTLGLLVASLVFRSPAFAFAAVLAVLVQLVAEAVQEKIFAMKNINLVIPEDLRKRIQDCEARLAAIEYGIKQRGY